MTNYTDVISLETAKLYLKVDAGQTETDAEITQMINSSLAYIEKRTNHIFKTKSKIYYKDCALVEQTKIYDYPIQNAPTETEIRPLYSIVPTVNGFVSLEVGYTDIDDIPIELIDCALSIINFWFYNSETKGADNSIPNFVQMAIDQNRRFL
jgi:hypothetical protein